MAFTVPPSRSPNELLARKVRAIESGRWLLETQRPTVPHSSIAHSYEYHQSVIDNARKAEATQAGRPLAIALDTKGPEIRTGNTEGDADIPISAGDILNITTDDAYATKSDNKNM